MLNGTKLAAEAAHRILMRPSVNSIRVPHGSVRNAIFRPRSGRFIGLPSNLAPARSAFWHIASTSETSKPM